MFNLSLTLVRTLRPSFFFCCSFRNIVNPKIFSPIILFYSRDSQPGVNLTCLGINFVSKKFTLLPISIGSCRSENIKNLGVHFIFEFFQGVNEKIKVENPCSKVSSLD